MSWSGQDFTPERDGNLTILFWGADNVLYVNCGRTSACSCNTGSANLQDRSEMWLSRDAFWQSESTRLRSPVLVSNPGHFPSPSRLVSGAQSPACKKLSPGSYDFSTHSRTTIRPGQIVYDAGRVSGRADRGHLITRERWYRCRGSVYSERQRGRGGGWSPV